MKNKDVFNDLQDRCEEIILLTDEFCQDRLNEEYAALARKVCAQLCDFVPSPLLKGKKEAWACGIMYALGSANWLFDPANELHIAAKDICEIFGVSRSTAASRSRDIQNNLEMDRFNPEWLAVDAVKNNPLFWYISIDGLLYDARNFSYAEQKKLFEAGVIPMIAAKENEEEEEKTFVLNAS